MSGTEQLANVQQMHTNRETQQINSIDKLMVSEVKRSKKCTEKFVVVDTGIHFVIYLN